MSNNLPIDLFTDANTRLVEPSGFLNKCGGRWLGIDTYLPLGQQVIEKQFCFHYVVIIDLYLVGSILRVIMK